MTTYGLGKPESEADKVRLDLLMTGNAYMVDGKRIPPESVVVYRLQTVADLETELCKGVESDVPVRHQDEFLTMLDELLDNTLHDDHCYIGPHDTTCVCIIGRLRAVLPPCGAVKDKGHGVYWTCTRTAHPANPNQHYYG